MIKKFLKMDKNLLLNIEKNGFEVTISGLQDIFGVIYGNRTITEISNSVINKKFPPCPYVESIIKDDISTFCELIYEKIEINEKDIVSWLYYSLFFNSSDIYYFLLNIFDSNLLLSEKNISTLVVDYLCQDITGLDIVYNQSEDLLLSSFASFFKYTIDQRVIINKSHDDCSIMFFHFIAKVINSYNGTNLSLFYNYLFKFIHSYKYLFMSSVSLIISKYLEFTSSFNFDKAKIILSFLEPRDIRKFISKVNIDDTVFLLCDSIGEKQVAIAECIYRTDFLKECKEFSACSRKFQLEILAKYNKFMNIYNNCRQNILISLLKSFCLSWINDNFVFPIVETKHVTFNSIDEINKNFKIVEILSEFLYLNPYPLEPEQKLNQKYKNLFVKSDDIKMIIFQVSELFACNNIIYVINWIESLLKSKKNYKFILKEKAFIIIQYEINMFFVSKPNIYRCALEKLEPQTIFRNCFTEMLYSIEPYSNPIIDSIIYNVYHIYNGYYSFIIFEKINFRYTNAETNSLYIQIKEIYDELFQKEYIKNIHINYILSIFEVFNLLTSEMNASPHKSVAAYCKKYLDSLLEEYKVEIVFNLYSVENKELEMNNKKTTLIDVLVEVVNYIKFNLPTYNANDLYN